MELVERVRGCHDPLVCTVGGADLITLFPVCMELDLGRITLQIKALLNLTVKGMFSTNVGIWSIVAYHAL